MWKWRYCFIHEKLCLASPCICSTPVLRLMENCCNKSMCSPRKIYSTFLLLIIHCFNTETFWTWTTKKDNYYMWISIVRYLHSQNEIWFFNFQDFSSAPNLTVFQTQSWKIKYLLNWLTYKCTVPCSLVISAYLVTAWWVWSRRSWPPPPRRQCCWRRCPRWRGRCSLFSWRKKCKMWGDKIQHARSPQTGMLTLTWGKNKLKNESRNKSPLTLDPPSPSQPRSGCPRSTCCWSRGRRCLPWGSTRLLVFLSNNHQNDFFAKITVLCKVWPDSGIEI